MTAAGDILRVPGFANSQKVADCIDAIYSIGIGLLSAGTTINDATVLSKTVNAVATFASANEGVKLWDAPLGQEVIVICTSPLGFKIYPHSGSVFINNLGAGVAYVLAATTSATLRRIGTAQWWVTSVS